MPIFNFNPAKELLGRGVLIVSEFEEETKKTKEQIFKLLNEHKKDFQKANDRLDKIYKKFEDIEIDLPESASDSDIDKTENQLSSLYDNFSELWDLFNNLEEIEIYD